ncbi:chromosomal replication initiator protein DnaA [bacterium]|nr:chromosomal replication initiator protein DnaA [bacterium]
MDMLEVQKIWSSVVEEIKNEIPSSSFEPWVLPLIPHAFENGTFSVLTGQSFAIQILKKYFALIENILTKEIGEKVEFNIIYDEKLAQKHNKKLQKLLAREENIEKVSQENPSGKYDNLKKMQSAPKLNLKYKFENFVVGENNKFAYAASMSTAKTPGEKYNPLFIYGGAGLGKTHLMQAIGHYVLYNHPELKVKFVKTEEFINDLITSIHQGMDKSASMTNFRQKYRNVDVLLIDDIQFIEGKERTVTEIFNTFEALHNAGKQIVITSDREPKYIQNLPDRLRSRFEWGLMVDVQPPDLETRMAIICNLAKNDGITLPLEIVEFLAKTYSKNVRELEGAYNRVTAYVGVCNIELNIDSVKQILNISDVEKQITLDDVLNIVADYYKLSPKDIKGQTRSQKLANARQVAIYVCREITDFSLNEIGDFFARKHPTIIYSHEKVKEDMETNVMLKNCVNEIIAKIKNS